MAVKSRTRSLEHPAGSPAEETGIPLFYYRTRGGTLCEEVLDGTFRFLLTDGERTHILPLSGGTYTEPAAGIPPYGGYRREELMASGRDLLAELALSGGEPDYRTVKALLPPLFRGTYALLGGVASSAGLTVDEGGVLYRQVSAGWGDSTAPLFSPKDCDKALGAIRPSLSLVGGEYPLLVSVHTDGKESLELLYFVTPTDPDRDPICWIRAKRYQNAAPEDATWEYRVATAGQEASAEEQYQTPPSEELFLDALYTTLVFWVRSAATRARFTLPERELAEIAHGASAMAAITCTGAHPHYGHCFYGKSLHDSFPPNYIFLIEASVLLGRHGYAREVFTDFVRYALREDGRIDYRQGASLAFGASAAEYGMLLHLTHRYRKILGVDALSQHELAKLRGMGEELILHILPCCELGGAPLIVMCAEADTNEREHAYLHNTLWAIRGLFALADLLGEEGARYRAAADTLKASVGAVLSGLSARDTRFGTLPPFRIGYTPTPLTLSRCEETLYPLKEQERAAYFGRRWERGDTGEGEDIAENCFANYRYYPEMLSSMLLPKDMADAVVSLREGLGGELLGMTRFEDRLNDWPVAHYARYLLESGRTEKYLLLLYAHAAHHGSPVLKNYYEQVAPGGEVRAYDCLPSLLTVPILLARAFAYERVEDGQLLLLPALPVAWYRLPFAARGLGYSGGLLDIVSDGHTLTVRFEEPPATCQMLFLRDRETVRPEELAGGQECIEGAVGNALLLKAGQKTVTLTLW